jgi:hypothetical protein
MNHFVKVFSMNQKIAIYLAGGIKKGHEKSLDYFWTDLEMDTIRDHLKEYAIKFLNPAFRTDDLSDSQSVFGRDMLQVYSSDIVFVDARDKRGLGVGAEMMWAKLHGIPVVTWAPMNSHYLKSETTVLGVDVKDFIHPFVAALSDKIAENLSDGADWIRQVIEERESVMIKNVKHINEAIEHYKATQLQHDLPMQELLLHLKTTPIMK